MKSQTTPPTAPSNVHESHESDRAAEQVLMEKMGIPDGIPKPTRTDAAFVSALREEVSQRRARTRWVPQLTAWGPALASAAALAWWVYPTEPVDANSSSTSQRVATIISSDHAENLLQDSLDVLDEEDMWLDTLDDESLLAFHDSLER